jgi:hypothetical protein
MMVDENIKAPRMTSPVWYRILVKGKLDLHWRDWFNGAEVILEHNKAGSPCTTLVCKVKDQAELLGILTRVNGLNLPLLQVNIIEQGGSDHVSKD